MNSINLKFHLKPNTLKSISQSTKLSERELKTLPINEARETMKARGVIKEPNPVFVFLKEQYIKLGKSLGFIDKRIQL